VIVSWHSCDCAGAMTLPGRRHLAVRGAEPGRTSASDQASRGPYGPLTMSSLAECDQPPTCADVQRPLTRLSRSWSLNQLWAVDGSGRSLLAEESP
jgi:hypothetical protein